MVSFKVDITRTVDVDGLLANASRDFLNRAMLAVHKSAAQPGVVPIDKGILRGSLSPGAGTTEVDSGNPPTWARVGTNLEYGRVLDEKGGRRYRGGPSSGAETKGWLTERGVDGAMPDIEKAVSTFAGEIEAGWKKGS